MDYSGKGKAQNWQIVCDQFKDCTFATPVCKTREEALRFWNTAAALAK
jgi:hypothetical protein